MDPQLIARGQHYPLAWEDPPGKVQKDPEGFLAPGLLSGLGRACNVAKMSNGDQILDH